MMDDCRAGKLDMIITKSVSRFGRNTIDCLNAIRELKTLGIDVFFEKEGIHSMRSEGELLLTMMMAVAEAERYNLSENIKWGKRRHYERGSTTSVSGRPPYGYIRGEDGFVPKEPEAGVVRRIFADYLDGQNMTAIGKRLTADGIPTPSGDPIWTTCEIKMILINEKYKGDIHYIKTLTWTR